MQISTFLTTTRVSAATMAKFDAETLIKYASQTEKALTNKTLSNLENLSPNVVLHQDAFTLNHDVEGEAAVKKYLQEYFDKYEFEHDTLNYAVNPESSASFALSYDKVCCALRIIAAWAVVMRTPKYTPAPSAQIAMLLNTCTQAGSMSDANTTLAECQAQE